MPGKYFRSSLNVAGHRSLSGKSPRHIRFLDKVLSAYSEQRTAHGCIRKSPRFFFGLNNHRYANQEVGYTHVLMPSKVLTEILRHPKL